YRLDEREALVVLAQLPPPGRYFGIQTYIFTREGEIDTTDEIYQSVADDPFMQSILFMMSPNPSRALVFSSIGNSNNNVVIERQSDAAFNQQRFFIITPDAVMERALTEALLRAGVPDRNQVFVEPVSTDLGRLGFGSKADDLMTVMRSSLPEDEAAGDEWRQKRPLAILRVRDTNTARPTEPYPKPVRDERIAKSELGFEGNVENLVEAVKQHWGQPDAKDGPFESLLLKVDLIGEHCVRRPMNCLGDTQDDPDLKGSASAFSETVGNTDKLYVYYFARDCGNLPNCREITEEMVPPGDAIKIIQRNYVVPGSTRGPDPKQLVNPTLIVFDGAKRPSSR
ncbi:MAG: hypothetical protein LOY00_09735, partial [Methylocaldum sp.]|nr:hypothetical protein [Methylocaldum sp.]